MEVQVLSTAPSIPNYLVSKTLGSPQYDVGLRLGRTEHLHRFQSASYLPTPLEIALDESENDFLNTCQGLS